MAIAVAVAWTVTRNRYEATGGDRQLIERVMLWTVILGFVGARGAYVLPRLDRFSDRWWGVFAVWEGGLALFGGLTIGAITAIVLLRRLGGSLGAFTDSAAVGVPLAQAIGRWGNYFNQELFGTPSSLPWAIEIDIENRPAAYSGFETFHPTFLYESVANVVLAGILIWVERRKLLPRGALLSVYMAGYGLVRFGLELIRTDTTFRFLGLSRNAWVALAVSLSGWIWFAVARTRMASRSEELMSG